MNAGMETARQRGPRLLEKNENPLPVNVDGNAKNPAEGESLLLLVLPERWKVAGRNSCVAKEPGGTGGNVFADGLECHHPDRLTGN